MIITETNNPLASTTGIQDESINLNSLYCSHLWKDSKFRKAMITGTDENKCIRYCYLCKGKIRKYEIRSGMDNFIPKTSSTPNGTLTEATLHPYNGENCTHEEQLEAICSYKKSSDGDKTSTYGGLKQCIPSISQQIDLNIRHKFTSYENHYTEHNQRRLRKSLSRMGCGIDFTVTDSPVKKRTQIRTCSISLMVIAIVAISFILVNFTTPAFSGATSVILTTEVPTNYQIENKTSSIHVVPSTDEQIITNVNSTEYSISTDYFTEHNTENNSMLSSIISKIRKNIRTYPKDASKNKDRSKPKDVINRDLSRRFCSCQTTEVCMLDENSGTSICRQSIDNNDPTGCGGLCALETEACQLVDKELGVRVCRQLMLATCLPHEWRCRNGLCVPAASRCNGSIQCYDGSDELHCECDLSRQFRCGQSMSCFSKRKLCDGTIDCWDGFDELNCTTTECPQDMHTCNDGHCILSSRFCDGLMDCLDGSDEPSGCDGDCGTREMRCENRRCVPQAVRCDGHDNCGDASDEINCF